LSLICFDLYYRIIHANFASFVDKIYNVMIIRSYYELKWFWDSTSDPWKVGGIERSVQWNWM